MTDIYNDEELMAEINYQFIIIIDAVADRVIKEIIIPSVQENVYDAYYPSQYTHRDEKSGRFIDSWEQQTTTENMNNVTSEIAINPLLMDLDEENYIHGSSLYGDVREMLADYIRTGSNYNFGFDMPRDFWYPILLALNEGGIDRIIESEMTKRGIVWIKV